MIVPGMYGVRVKTPFTILFSNGSPWIIYVTHKTRKHFVLHFTVIRITITRLLYENVAKSVVDVQLIKIYVGT